MKVLSVLFLALFTIEARPDDLAHLLEEISALKEEVKNLKGKYFMKIMKKVLILMILLIQPTSN